jgi:hypothetical protein
MIEISRTGRLAAALLAAIGWAALILQLVLIIGTVTAAGGTWPRAVLNFFSFFTILTNVLIAALMTALAFGRALPASLPGAAALYIAVVGIVYSLLLRAIWDPRGWQKVADMALHDVMPVLAVAFWLVFVPKGRLAWRDALPWLAYPLAYFAYAIVRGGVDGWYPYPFLDVGKLGYAAVFGNALVLTAAFLAGGLIVVALDRLLGQTSRQSTLSPP